MSERPPIVHVDQLEWIQQQQSPNFHCFRKQLGAVAGGQKLGCSLYELPPGCRSWPYHYHYANEEAIYILAGTGTLRLAGEEIAVTPETYIALPAGKNSAHQLINTGNVPLRYLCFSTMVEPDITAYPDSGKVGVFAGTPPGGNKEKRTLSEFFPVDAAVDYWDGEG
ncbi:MAG: cupin domain-containing protein [Actinomycetota bacterium]